MDQMSPVSENLTALTIFSKNKKPLQKKEIYCRVSTAYIRIIKIAAELSQHRKCQGFGYIIRIS